MIYKFLNERGAQVLSFPSFSVERHSVLCSELKQLYVAITRTRQKLWICESSEEYSEPMFDYRRRSKLVQTWEIDDSLAHAMQTSSTPEEWKSQGMKVKLICLVPLLLELLFVQISFLCCYMYLSTLIGPHKVL